MAQQQCTMVSSHQISRSGRSIRLQLISRFASATSCGYTDSPITQPAVKADTALPSPSGFNAMRLDIVGRKVGCGGSQPALSAALAAGSVGG